MDAQILLLISFYVYLRTALLVVVCSLQYFFTPWEKGVVLCTHEDFSAYKPYIRFYFISWLPLLYILVLLTKLLSAYPWSVGSCYSILLVPPNTLLLGMRGLLATELINLSAGSLANVSS